jgi:ribosome-binding protein aMBF1 (putative translation factor)
MEYCYKCEIPETKALLFDVVLLDGIQKVCRKCSFKEDAPIIRKKEILPEPPKPSVYERLSKLSGFDSKEKTKNEELEKQDIKLKEVLNRNFRRTIGMENFKEDLIDNFHWVIMRARRSKHLTQKQVADSVKEPEVSIRMVERGFANDMNLVKKIEDFLSIRLRKSVENYVEEVKYSELKEEVEDDFDRDKLRGFTIEDIRKMKEEKEFEIFNEPDVNDFVDADDSEED